MSSYDRDYCPNCGSMSCSSNCYYSRSDNTHDKSSDYPYFSSDVSTREEESSPLWVIIFISFFLLTGSLLIYASIPRCKERECRTVLTNINPLRLSAISPYHEVVVCPECNHVHWYDGKSSRKSVYTWQGHRVFFENDEIVCKDENGVIFNPFDVNKLTIIEEDLKFSNDVKLTEKQNVFIQPSRRVEEWVRKWHKPVLFCLIMLCMISIFFARITL